MPYTFFISQLLPFFVLLGDIFLGLAFLVWVYHALTKKDLPLVRSIWGFIQQNGLLLAFLIALFATISSLFYSEVAGFAECELCWFQRLFMYPQVIILGVVLTKKTRDVVYYTIPLSVIGASISIYQYLLQRLPAASCSLGNVDCSAKNVFSFGYITIPVMALTAFIFLIFFVYAQSKNS